MFLNVDNVGAERMFSGRLFQTTGPSTEKLMSGCRVVIMIIKKRNVDKSTEYGLT